MNHVIKTGSPVYFSSFINYLQKIISHSSKSTLPNDRENAVKDFSFNAGSTIAKKSWLQGLRKKKVAISDLPCKVLYKEKTASGFSHLNWYTKTGVVKNCLCLEIVGDVLRITPSFQYPGLTEILDLEHEIKADSIIDISEKIVAFKDSLLIKYLDSDDMVHTIEILPKNLQNFRNALKEMMLQTNH
ncbi:MAG: hypothetical protein OEQ24_05955 [Gammaproteobacteria bacterium]|nr:hypothetical protein [Gammaproteobacteria bacterium]